MFPSLDSSRLLYVIEQEFLYQKKIKLLVLQLVLSLTLFWLKMTLLFHVIGSAYRT